MLIAAIVIAGILVYAWCIYPVLIMALGRRTRDATASRRDAAAGDMPPVVVMFSAHNEETVIRQKLENLDGLDYPRERFRVLVGVDGGHDRTAQLARVWAQAHPYVRVEVSDTNRGKAAMLKRLVNGAKAEDCRLPTAVRSSGGEGGLSPGANLGTVFVFTDANTMFAPDAVRLLVAPLADPGVGGVCGRLVFVRALPGSLSQGADGRGTTDEPAYWNIETSMKAAESALDSCLGANGAIYAIRAGLFPADFADNTVIDDFVIGMKVREQGFRMVYEAEALAYEEPPDAVIEEWRRRVRIGAGAYQALAACRRCLLPRYGALAWMFWSHKVLRWFTPHLVVAWAGLSIVSLAGGGGSGCPGGLSPVGGLMCGMICLGGLAAGIGWLARRSAGRWAVPFRLLNYFLVMQGALLMGFFRFCRGDLTGSWKRTERR